MKLKACKDCEHFVVEDEYCVRHEKLVRKIKGCSRTQGSKMFLYSNGNTWYFGKNKKKGEKHDNNKIL